MNNSRSRCGIGGGGRPLAKVAGVSWVLTSTSPCNVRVGLGGVIRLGSSGDKRPAMLTVPRPASFYRSGPAARSPPDPLPPFDGATPGLTRMNDFQWSEDRTNHPVRNDRIVIAVTELHPDFHGVGYGGKFISTLRWISLLTRSARKSYVRI